MRKVAIYSFLLILGMFFSQIADLRRLDPFLENATMICLAYIMIEVGFEFVIDKTNLKSYLVDYLIAMTAAALPWLFCALYFFFFIDTDIFEALIIGRFAAPTSAGVLFAMLISAGLGATWLFKKARILAIFDDLDTIILMVPLQVMIVGFRKESIYLIFFIISLFVLAYVYLHKLRVPVKKSWFVLYGALVVLACELVEHTVKVQFEVLLPAFALGAILYNPHLVSEKDVSRDDFCAWLDGAIKMLFMFLVGCSLPRIEIVNGQYGYMALHVLVLTLLSNLGKMFPTFCYQKEAPWRERLALSISMFPRGEVGAGVLLVVIEYGLQKEAITLGALSLVLNLLLTGAFIAVVIKLIEPAYTKVRNGASDEHIGK